MSCKRCFKCQGLAHIASDCPNKKVITLAEWESIRKDDEEEGREENMEGKKVRERSLLK